MAFLINPYLFVDESDMKLLDTFIANGSSPAITFSAIDQTYSHLQIMGFGRVAGAVQETNLFMQFNGDSSSSYYSQTLNAGAATLAGSGANNATSMQIGWIAGSSSPAQTRGQIQVFINGYTDTDFTKSATSLSGVSSATSSIQRIVVGGYLGPVAITSILIGSTSGNFVANSKFQLYGIK